MYKFINQGRLKRIALGCILIAITIPSLIILSKNIIATSTKHMHQLFTPQKIVCFFHDIFTQNLKTDITSYLTETLTQTSITAADQTKIFTELKTKFPIIKNTEWKLLPSQTLQVSICGTKPHCIINNKYVLGNQRKLLCLNNFSIECLKKLPIISIKPAFLKQKNIVSKDLYLFLHAIPNWLWSGYTINYQRPTRIEITPKQSLCSCTILADTHTALNMQKWDALNSIFTDVAQKHFITKKMLQTKQPVIALDMRLKNRIIVKFFQSMARGRGS